MASTVLAVDARDLHKQMQVVKETVRREIELLEQQISKSRAARSASPFAPASLTATPRQPTQHSSTPSAKTNTTTTATAASTTSATTSALHASNSPNPVPPVGSTPSSSSSKPTAASNFDGKRSDESSQPTQSSAAVGSGGGSSTLDSRSNDMNGSGREKAASTAAAAAAPPSSSPIRGESNVDSNKLKESPFHRSKLAAQDAGSSPSPPPVPRSPYSSSQQRDLEAKSKSGYLLHFVKSRFSEKFVQHFIVASEERDGIVWYENEKDAERQQRELGFVPFYAETRNSRGSRFKKAAVCWPLILEEDCSKAKDPSKTYFAVEYYTETPGKMDGRYEKLIFATDVMEERNEWVFFLTKYVGLYLVPREESVELQSLPRGAEKPVHESVVLDGEAPGGNVR